MTLFCFSVSIIVYHCLPTALCMSLQASGAVVVTAQFSCNRTSVEYVVSPHATGFAIEYEASNKSSVDTLAMVAIGIGCSFVLCGLLCGCVRFAHTQQRQMRALQVSLQEAIRLFWR
jgi:TctA family transporter